MAEDVIKTNCNALHALITAAAQKQKLTRDEEILIVGATAALNLLEKFMRDVEKIATVQEAKWQKDL